MSGPPGGWGQPPRGGWKPPGPTEPGRSVPAPSSSPPPSFGAAFGPAAPAAPPPPRKSKKGFFVSLAVFGGVVLLSCCGCLTWAFWSSQEEQQRLGALAGVCDGHALARAQAHPAAHARGIVVVRGANDEWRFDTLLTPSRYEPGEIEDASFVVCLDDAEEVTVDRCAFVETMVGIDLPGTEESYPRTRQRAAARLVAARTAEVIATSDVWGPEAPSCDSWSGEPSASDFEGDDITAAEVQSWLDAQLAGAR